MHYESYWQLHASPFENVPDSSFYYPSPKHEEAIQRLLYGVQGRKGAVLLTGEIGCGKTLSSRALVARLVQGKYDIAIITNPSLPTSQFLVEVWHQLGVKAQTNAQNANRIGGQPPVESLASLPKVELLQMMNDHLVRNLKKGVDTVVMIDEAQAIEDDQIFEELRLLLNFQLESRYLLTLVLIGQPELQDRISAIPQLAQRIGVRYHLLPFTFTETMEYMTSRLNAAGGVREIFTQRARDRIFQLTDGVPRKINTVCDLSLLLGFVKNAHQIDDVLVDLAAADGL